MEDGKERGYCEGQFDTIRELDDTYRMAEAPPGFKASLYPHQMTMLQALLDVYRQRYIRDDLGRIVQCNALVLADSLGSGKTIEILVLILSLQSQIKAVPDTVLGSEDEHGYRPRTEIVRRFSTIMRPAVIHVGSSVLLQWQQAIRQFTNLHVYTVVDVRTLREFYEEFKKGINRYDIILVKNGMITGEFLLDTEIATAGAPLRPIYNAVCDITGSAAWSLAVYDDFDTIKIDKTCRNVPALFTIYVSATSRNNYQRAPKETFATTAEFVRARSSIALNKIFCDANLHSVFRLRNSSDYVAQSTKVTMVDQYKYTYHNPDDKYMKLLGVMGDADAANIMEMLNGDAIGTAADALGIKTTSIADIFSRMLDKKYEKYLEYGEIRTRVEDYIVELKGLPWHQRDRHSAAELEYIRDRILKNAQITADALIKNNSDNIKPCLVGITGEVVKLQEESGRAVNRVKDNLKEGECQVCNIPLQDEDNKGTVINKCCGLVLCSVCCIKSSKLNIQGQQLKGMCPNCRFAIDATTDIIFVSREFNLQSICTARGDEKTPIVKLKEKAPAAPIQDEDIKNPKLRAVLHIVRGIKPEGQTESAREIRNMIRGIVNIAPNAKTPRKVLLFANYNETLTMVEEFLQTRSIEFIRLCGTYSQRHKLIDTFKSKATVMLINSSDVCAGLNLQFATDLIFFHKMIDVSCEAQVIARGQRIGRKQNLQVHNLYYNNEDTHADAAAAAARRR